MVGTRYEWTLEYMSWVGENEVDSQDEGGPDVVVGTIEGS